MGFSQSTFAKAPDVSELSGQAVTLILTEGDIAAILAGDYLRANRPISVSNATSFANPVSTRLVAAEETNTGGATAVAPVADDGAAPSSGEVMVPEFARDQPSAAFGTSNIVVYRVGTGAAGLSNAATAVFLDEYTTSGTLVQSIAVPQADSGANQTLTASGTATSEGQLTRSFDGRYLLFSGYDATPGTASVASSASASIARVIGRVDASGTVDTTTTTTAFSGNNIRDVASTNGTDIWAVGGNTGVVYTTFGSSGAGTIVSSTATNFRTIEIFDGQLFYSSGSGSFRVGSVGTGTPTTTGQVSANLTGTPTTGSPYGVFFADLTAAVAGVDTLYVADDGTDSILKYSLIGGTWTATGSIAALDVRGLTGVVSGTSVTLYGTTGGGGSTGGGSIYAVTDASGYNGTASGAATVIATASANTSFRGIALAPQAPENQVISIATVTTSIAEGNSGNTLFQFTVTRTGGTSGALAFEGVFNALQTNAADFTGGVLPNATFDGTIAAGATSATVTISVAADTVIETNELFNLTLTSGSSAGNVVTLGTTSATARILNDDAAGGIPVNGQTVLQQGDSTLTGSVALPVATNTIQLARLGNIAGTGATAAGRGESVAFNAANATLYVTNVPALAIDRMIINADGSLTLGTPISLAGLTQYGAVNSVAVRNGIIAVTYDNVTAGQGGYVALFDVATNVLLRTIQVGPTPDHVVFTPDGNRILIANEAEAISSTDNPAGSISIIDVSGGAATAVLQSTISFTSFGPTPETALRNAGLPIFAGQNAANDIEPEYIAVSADGTRAYVTLQEVNGVAVIDLTNPAATAPIAILPLGYVDRNLAGNQFDPSDQNGISLGNWNVRSLLQPDALATFTIAGTTYFITANEGDARVGTGLVDEIRLGAAGYNLDDALFPNETTLKQNGNLGRLNVLTSFGDTEGDGDFDQIYTLGARSVSIFRQNADGSITKVRETGGEFERILAANYTNRYNIDSGGTTIDDRSDNKGPEPEGVVVGVVNGRSYAFISLERAGGIIVYDVTDPANANFVTYMPAQTPTAGGDSAPEVITFIAAADSPTGAPLVVTSNEGSGTTTIYRVDLPAAGAQNPVGTIGNDTRTGSSSSDFFDFSQGGTDAVFGLDGNDGFLFGAAFTNADRVDGGAGSNDQVGLEGDYATVPLVLAAQSLVNVEVLAVLPGFNYNITTVDANVAAGQELVIFGGRLGAANSLTFNGSAETNGTFRVYGGAGTDTVRTGAGNDGVYFGPGNFGATDFIDAGAGTNDQVALDGTYTATITGTQLQNVEVLALLRGLTGDLGAYNITLANSLVGAGQTFTVFGLAVETGFTLDASAELDGIIRVIGGSGVDTITTGAGADRLFGGNGGDTLTGGAGADTFAFDAVVQSTGLGYDRITDFVSGSDRIDVGGATTGIGATINGGALSTASFNADLQAAFVGLAAGNAALFKPTTGTLAGTTFLVVDINGVAGYQEGADYVIQLTNNPLSIGIGDFI